MEGEKRKINSENSPFLGQPPEQVEGQKCPWGCPCRRSRLGRQQPGRPPSSPQWPGSVACDPKAELAPKTPYLTPSSRLRKKKLCETRMGIEEKETKRKSCEPENRACATTSKRERE